MITIPEINYQFGLLVTLVKGYIDDIAGSDIGTFINILGSVFDAMIAYGLFVRLSTKGKNAASVSVDVNTPTRIDSRDFRIH